MELRFQHRWGADHIAHETGIAASTVQRILHANGVGRLDKGDRATAAPVRRHQRDRPGELIHVDVKKIAGIPDGGGWRRRGRGFDGQFRTRPVRCRFIHTVLDDRTRMIYSEILDNEQAVTAAGFWA